MQKRTWLCLVLSLAAHAVLVSSSSQTVWERDVWPRTFLGNVELGAEDHLLVLVENEVPLDERDVLADEQAEYADAECFEAVTDEMCDADVIGLGDPRFASTAPFEGPATNGVIGIGGGAGGAWGGRRGGRRNLRAGGGGRKSAWDAVAWPKEQLRLVGRRDGEEIGAFPLTHTDVEADVSGWIASSRLTQTYANPFDHVVEAVYVFPLPSNAAVNEFVMEIEGRRVVGVVKPREEAERIYAEARRRGRTASLMTQERPNAFTQSVANIAPGEAIDVSVTYFHALRYESGSYEYVFPMTVGPRYMPGAVRPSTGRASDAGGVVGGGGAHPDTTAVPDASRISPPVLPEGVRSGRDVAVSVTIDAGIAIGAISSPTHELVVEHDGGAWATVALADRDTHPNKDLVIRWTIAADEILPGFIAHRGEEHGGFFSAFLVPMLDPSDADVGAREVTFVLDTSGSMEGIPLDTSKALVRTALRDLRPYDRFNVIQFAGSTGSLSDAPIDATPENVQRGLSYVRNLAGGGGTEMLKGLQAWLDQPGDERYLRTVVFLTDGFIGDEERIFATIRDQGQDARWFSFGIGSSVNRYLVEGIAEHGRGACEVVIPKEPEAALQAAARLRERFDAPLLLNVTVDTNGLPIEDIYPKRVPDLFAGQPVRVIGRYTAPAEGELLFRGTVAGRSVSIPVRVVLPEEQTEHASLAAMWARTRVHEIESDLHGTEGDDRDAHLAQIEQLGVEFDLVTRRTAFIAVDDGRFVGDGFPIRVLQPSEIPDGVRYWGAVGAPPGTLGLHVAGWGLTLAESKDGELMVARVQRRGLAARAGLSRGFVVETVAGHRVHNAQHFRALVRQTTTDDVAIGYRNGAGEAVRTTTLGR